MEKKKMTKEKVKQWAKEHMLEIGCVVGAVVTTGCNVYAAYAFDRRYIRIKRDSPIGKVLDATFAQNGGYIAYDGKELAEAGLDKYEVADTMLTNLCGTIIFGNVTKKSE